MSRKSARMSPKKSKRRGSNGRAERLQATVERLDVELRQARWMLAAVLKNAGGRTSIDPNVFNDGSQYEITRRDLPSGIIVLKLSDSAPKRIIEGSGEPDGKGREADENTTAKGLSRD